MAPASWAVPNLERFACWQHSFFISKKNALSGKLKGFLQSWLHRHCWPGAIECWCSGDQHGSHGLSSHKKLQKYFFFFCAELVKFLISFECFQPASLKMFFPLAFFLGVFRFLLESWNYSLSTPVELWSELVSGFPWKVTGCPLTPQLCWRSLGERE